MLEIRIQIKSVTLKIFYHLDYPIFYLPHNMPEWFKAGSDMLWGRFGLVSKLLFAFLRISVAFFVADVVVVVAGDYLFCPSCFRFRRCCCCWRCCPILAVSGVIILAAVARYCWRCCCCRCLTAVVESCDGLLSAILFRFLL